MGDRQFDLMRVVTQRTTLFALRLATAFACDDAVAAEHQRQKQCNRTEVHIHSPFMESMPITYVITPITTRAATFIAAQIENSEMAWT